MQVYQEFGTLDYEKNKNFNILPYKMIETIKKLGKGLEKS